MKRLFLLFLIVLTMGCAGTGNWTTKEKALAGTFMAGQVANYAQIRYIQEHDEWDEMNPLIENTNTRTGLIVWKAVTTGIILVVADGLSHKWRERMLWASNFLVWGLVGHDAYVGVGVQF